MARASAARLTWVGRGAGASFRLPDRSLLSAARLTWVGRGARGTKASLNFNCHTIDLTTADRVQQLTIPLEALQEHNAPQFNGRDYTIWIASIDLIENH